ncbi:MAG TPA: ABATE domain-containing protein [Micromonosporaceae bacterium]|nr:ABATE domain-containing protein [Micromonosporaceae bacterium]
MELFVGEPLALDLVNTLTRDFDALDSPQAWLESQVGRLTPPSAPLSTADVAALRALRAHMRAAIDAVRQGQCPPDTAVDALNEAARAAPAYPVLQSDLHQDTRRDGDERARLLAQLADAAITLLADPNADRIRGCEGPRCRMLFLPAHPNRRWCSPQLCGNRARVARYYQRQRAT